MSTPNKTQNRYDFGDDEVMKKYQHSVKQVNIFVAALKKYIIQNNLGDVREIENGTTTSVTHENPDDII
jgi:hypothetical protein